MSKTNFDSNDANNSLISSKCNSNQYRREIIDELKKVLTPYTENKELLRSINEQTNLLTDLKINSANLVDVIIDAESKYSIEIDLASAEKMTNVRSCIDVIVEKMNFKK
ncbi:MAG TPA: acyl carrier protein [Chitinophagaceae bacterium]|nr:acyl carrier protein [Chitinophagaceae bacterium]